MEDLRNRYESLVEKLRIEEKREKIRELERESMDGSFWQDHKAAALKMKELSVLQKEIEEVDYVRDLIESDMEKDAKEIIEKLEILLYFSQDYDLGPAI